MFKNRYILDLKEKGEGCQAGGKEEVAEDALGARGSLPLPPSTSEHCLGRESVQRSGSGVKGRAAT